MRIGEKLRVLQRLPLMRKSLSSLGIKLTNIFLGTVLAIVLARFLGPAGLGTYSYIYAILMLLAIPTQLGLPKLVVRETAKAEVSDNWGAVRGLWRWSNILVCGFSVVIVIGVILFTSTTKFNYANLLLLGVILIPLNALGNIRGASLRGLGRVILGQLPETIVRPIVFLCLILVFNMFWVPDTFTPESAMLLNIIASGIAFAFGFVLLAKSIPQPLWARPTPEYHHKPWITALLPLGLISGIQIINSNLDIIMLGVFRTPEEVGIYKVVVMAAGLVVFGLQAINMVIMPSVARMHEQKDMANLQKLVTSSARMILAIALTAALVFFVFGHWILETAFGSEFSDGYNILVVLVAGQLANAAFGSVALLLNMGGHEKETLVGVALAACANVALNLLLIPLYGGWGAAMATSITLLVWNGVLCWRVYAKMGVNSTAFGRGFIR